MKFYELMRKSNLSLWENETNSNSPPGAGYEEVLETIAGPISHHDCGCGSGGTCNGSCKETDENSEELPPTLTP